MAKKKTKGKSVKAKKKSAPKKKTVKKKSAAKNTKKKAAPKKTKKAVKKKPIKKAAKKTIKKTIKKTTKKKALHKKPLAKKVVKKVAAVKPAVDTNASSVAETETFKKHVTRLKAGDRAPFFEGVDQFGNRITSLDFPGKTIILFFYPQDDTETCTIEACNLRDEFKYLGDNNYAVIGVSPDGVDSHKRFAEKYDLPYPLIADTDKKIITDFDVWGQKQLFGRIYDGLLRTTFVIGNEGIIQQVITEVKAADHARQITGSDNK